MLPEVLAALGPKPGERFVDGTFGQGGYSRAILEACDCQVLALDRDPSVAVFAEPLRAAFGSRFQLAETPFGQLAGIAEERGFMPVDGVVLDIGVSSMQLDLPERGFSFMTDGPLDMRMGADGASAADLVNGLDERKLADVLWQFGEEKRSRAIAKAVVAQRKITPILRTSELAALVEKTIGRKPGDPKHPATRTFQALRIAVNDELPELSRALTAAEQVLKPGGRIVVVTFHSLEDRIVKDFLKARSERAARQSRHMPSAKSPEREPSFQFINPRPLSPSEREISQNPRARSAKLRSAVRTAAPAFGAD